MALFRRKREETLNEQLLREARVEDAPAPVLEVLPAFPGEVGVMDPAYSGLPGRPAVERPALWDAQVVADDSRLKETRYEFTAVPDGSLIVDESCDEDLSRLADAVERELPPPYRAVANRAGAGVWVVTATKTTVLDLGPVEGDRIELSNVGERQQLVLDGVLADAGRAPALLRQLGETKGRDYAVQAERIDGNLWDVTASPL